VHLGLQHLSAASKGKGKAAARRGAAGHATSSEEESSEEQEDEKEQDQAMSAAEALRQAKAEGLTLER